MSILLDAVVRNKQQNSAGNFDPALTPRPQTGKHKKSIPLKGIVSVCISVGLGFGLSWLLSTQWPQPLTRVGQMESIVAGGQNQLQPQNQQQIHEPTQAVLGQNYSQQSQEQALAPKIATISAQQISPIRADQEIRLAAKVALPEAKARPLPTYRQPQAEAGPRRGDHQAQNSQDVSVAVMAEKRNGGALNESSQPNRESMGEREPIILGANANARGQQELASLRLEVERAANVVGLNQQPDAVDLAEVRQKHVNQPDLSQPAIQNSSQAQTPRLTPEQNNNLVAAFEAALKEVEVESSVNQELTAPQLNPIPQSDTTETIPKYGQLPATLQSQVPEFNIFAHVYAGAPEKRWLNVDGIELQQGDLIGGKLRIIEIRPRDVVLDIQGTEFKVPAI